jgi:hypothetical protein
MAEQLYLTYVLSSYSEETMFRYYEKALRLFPFSRLARNPSTFKVVPVDYTEAAVLEVPLPAPVSINQVLSAARDFQNPDSCYRLETWWDLWQFEGEWKLMPSRVALSCFGPEFQRDSDANLEIEFGLEAHFLPQPDLSGSVRMIQANIQSLLKLVHDLDDALPVETRRLWSESGENFSEKLQQALENSEWPRINADER